MAAVKYGSNVVSLRGKLGGTVFQKCGSVEGLRVQKSQNWNVTGALSTNRGIMARIANYWASLDESSKNNIAAVASTYPAYDKHGNPITPNAYQVFVMVNMLMIRNPYGMIVPVQPFTPPPPLALQQSDYDCMAENCNISVQGDIYENMYIYLYVGKPQRSKIGINSAKMVFCGYVLSQQLLTTNVFFQVLLSIFGNTIPQPGAYNGWYLPIQLKIVVPFTGSWRDTNVSTLYIFNPHP